MFRYERVNFTTNFIVVAEMETTKERVHSIPTRTLSHARGLIKHAHSFDRCGFSCGRKVF